MNVNRTALVVVIALCLAGCDSYKSPTEPEITYKLSTITVINEQAGPPPWKCDAYDTQGKGPKWCENDPPVPPGQAP
jgi:hypothetical protein